MNTVVHSVAVAALLALAGTAGAQQSVASRTVVTPEGVRTVAQTSPLSPGWSPTPDSVQWVYENTFAGLPANVSISGSTQQVWVGQTLNGERLERLDFADNVPDFSFTAGLNAPAGVAASEGADLAVFLDGASSSGPFTLRAFNSTSTSQLWSFDFPPEFNNAFDSEMWNRMRVSRDGQVAAVAITAFDQATSQGFSRVWFFNAQTGAVISTYTSAIGRFVNGVDMTDDGSRVVLTENDTAVVVTTSNAAVEFSAAVSGSGGRFKISGNGETMAAGGFNFRAFRRSGTTWTQTVSFSTSGNWFGAAIGVSGDGRTVGTMTFDFVQSYLVNNLYIWDAVTGAQVATLTQSGTGGFQNTPIGGVMNDDGSRFTVASWGTQDNANPEVQIFDRSLNRVGSIDTFGSPFGVDMSADGRAVVAGSKGGHANSFGNGRDVTLWLDAPPACRPDLNADGELTFDDIQLFISLFNANDNRADFNGDQEWTFDDIQLFISLFNAGC
jgi:hypothetical protein